MTEGLFHAYHRPRVHRRFAGLGPRSVQAPLGCLTAVLIGKLSIALHRAGVRDLGAGWRSGLARHGSAGRVTHHPQCFTGKPTAPRYSQATVAHTSPLNRAPSAQPDPGYLLASVLVILSVIDDIDGWSQRGLMIWFHYGLTLFSVSYKGSVQSGRPY